MICPAGTAIIRAAKLIYLETLKKCLGLLVANFPLRYTVPEIPGGVPRRCKPMERHSAQRNTKKLEPADRESSGGREYNLLFGSVIEMYGSITESDGWCSNYMKFVFPWPSACLFWFAGANCSPGRLTAKRPTGRRAGLHGQNEDLCRQQLIHFGLIWYSLC